MKPSLPKFAGETFSTTGRFVIPASRIRTICRRIFEGHDLQRIMDDELVDCIPPNNDPGDPGDIDAVWEVINHCEQLLEDPAGEPAMWRAALRDASLLLQADEELEPTSALKQAGHDAGIGYGETMGRFVEWARGQPGFCSP